jgi:hypothetical protein
LELSHGEDAASIAGTAKAPSISSTVVDFACANIAESILNGQVHPAKTAVHIGALRPV